MPYISLLILLNLAPFPVDLDGLSIDRARHLSGRVVVAGFLSVKPVDYRQDHRGQWFTVLGAADRDDDVERGAFVRGRRFDLDGGRRVAVVGVLRVIDHPAAFVGPVFVPGWSELRVTGLAPRVSP